MRPRAAGIKDFGTNAAGEGFGKGYNGHYTWPRFGYEGKISGTAFRSLPLQIQANLDGMGKSRSIRDLFEKVPGGKEAWQKMKIGTVPMHFDTSPKSRHSKALADYIEERKNRPKKKPGTGTG